MYIFWTHHHPITPFTLSTLCTTQTPISSFISPLLSFPLDTSFPGQLAQEPHQAALQDGHSDEGSRRWLAGLGTGTTP